MHRRSSDPSLAAAALLIALCAGCGAAPETAAPQPARATSLAEPVADAIAVARQPPPHWLTRDHTPPTPRPGLPLEQACRLGSPGACLAVGDFALTASRIDDAIEAFDRACDQGEPLSCLKRAQLYAEAARGGPMPEAWRLAARGCEAGFLVACSQIGWWVQRGQGTPADPAVGGEILDTTCAAGDLDGCAARAERLRFDDPSRAAERVESSCAQGHTASCVIALAIDLGLEDRCGPVCDLIRAGPLEGEAAEAMAQALSDHLEPLCPVAGPTLACVAYARAVGASEAERAADILDAACAGGSVWGCSSRAALASRPEIPLSERVTHLERACDMGATGACTDLAVLHIRQRWPGADPMRGIRMARDACLGGHGPACKVFVATCGQGGAKAACGHVMPAADADPFAGCRPELMPGLVRAICPGFGLSLRFVADAGDEGLLEQAVADRAAGERTTVSLNGAQYPAVWSTGEGERALATVVRRGPSAMLAICDLPHGNPPEPCLAATGSILRDGLPMMLTAVPTMPPPMLAGIEVPVPPGCRQKRPNNIHCDDDSSELSWHALPHIDMAAQALDAHTERVAALGASEPPDAAAARCAIQGVDALCRVRDVQLPERVLRVIFAAAEVRTRPLVLICSYTRSEALPPVCRPYLTVLGDEEA